MFFAIAVVFFVIFLTIFLCNQKPAKAPPGPWGFPILGHLPLLGENPAKTLLKWKEKYGPIISVRFGSLNAVVFNDIKTAKEAFNMHAFNGRKDVSFFPEATENGKGIVYGTGPSVFEQRRFVMKAMKDFGFRNSNIDMESIIQTEISELLNTFKKTIGQPMKLHKAFCLSTVNSIWITLTGKRFEHGDPTLSEFANISSALFEYPVGFQLLAYYIPWLAKLMPNLSGYNKGLNGFRKITEFMRTQVKELNNSRVKDQPRNVADAYMDKVEDTMDETSSFHPKKEFLPFTLGDAFLGGIDPVSTMLEWILAYLAVNQNVQRKLQQEIFQVTGNTRTTCLADRASMPYTEAVILEVERIVAIVTFNIGKEALEDVPFHDYIIRKGTMIHVNFYAIFHDPEIWEDPNIFRPERFIDDNGKFFRSDVMIPFGYGKRVCIGESFTKDQLFLCITGIFQRFNVNCAPGKEMNLHGKYSVVVHPDESNEVVLSERQ